MLLQAIDSHREDDRIAVGTSTGLVLCYGIDVDVACAKCVSFEKDNGPKIVLDKDVSDLTDSNVFQGEFDQHESDLPVY